MEMITETPQASSISSSSTFLHTLCSALIFYPLSLDKVSDSYIPGTIYAALITFVSTIVSMGIVNIKKGRDSHLS